MKLITLFLSLFVINSLAFGQEEEKYKPTAPSNAQSAGSSEKTGISDRPLGATTAKEKKEVRKRAGSMGGAPNLGGGMGTGTGAGSSKKNTTGRGTLTAGAASGDEDKK